MQVFFKNRQTQTLYRRVSFFHLVKEMKTTTILEGYLKAYPMALQLALALSGSRKATATELASEFGVSVPTMYRLTSHMEELGILVSERVGRRRVFALADEATTLVSELAPWLDQALEKKGEKISQRLKIAKMLKEDLAIPVSLRSIHTIVRPAIKLEINKLLPKSLRRARIISESILGERPRFDLVLRDNKDKIVAVEIKIIDTPRTARERLGVLASYAAFGLPISMLILVYLVYPVPGTQHWLVDAEKLNQALSSLIGGKLKIVPIVEKVTELEAFDVEKIKKIAMEVVRNIMEE